MSKKILIIDYPIPIRFKSSYKFIDNFIFLIKSYSDSIIISDNYSHNDCNVIRLNVSTHLFSEISPKYLSLIFLALNNILYDVKLIFNLIRLRNDFEVTILFMMPLYTLIIPSLFLKIIKKKIIRVPLNPTPKKYISVSKLMTLLECITDYFTDYYIPEYENNIPDILKSTSIKQSKILLPAHFYILEANYRIYNKIVQREKSIAYIGGFRKIKGVINFVRSIEYIIKNNEDLKVYIVGDGVLKSEIVKMISFYPENVILVDWIPHYTLPNFLNKIKLLVVPSFSEGVPNIALEAMACGTPILSTNVGVIPFIITDKKNGFILKNNDPKEISEQVTNFFKLSNEEIENIVSNARKTIELEYTIESTKIKWLKNFNIIYKLQK